MPYMQLSRHRQLFAVIPDVMLPVLFSILTLVYPPGFQYVLSLLPAVAFSSS